jgi:hypothetical protein
MHQADAKKKTPPFKTEHGYIPNTTIGEKAKRLQRK